MLKNAVLVLGAIAVLALVGAAIYYIQNAAPVQISDKPPAAATLAVGTTPAPSGKTKGRPKGSE